MTDYELRTALCAGVASHFDQPKFVKGVFSVSISGRHGLSTLTIDDGRPPVIAVVTMTFSHPIDRDQPNVFRVRRESPTSTLLSFGMAPPRKLADVATDIVATFRREIGLAPAEDTVAGGDRGDADGTDTQ